MNQPTSALRILQVIRDGGGTPGVELRVAVKLRAAGERYGDRPLIAQQLDAAVPWALALVDLAAAGTDVMISDSAVFGGALAARLTGLPSVSLMPTVYLADEFTTGPAVALVQPANRIRSALGLPPADSFADQFLNVDRLLMLTVRELEPPEVTPQDRVRYVGPQLPAADAGSVEADPIPEGSVP